MGEFTITIRGSSAKESDSAETDPHAMAAELVTKLRAAGIKVWSAKFCTPDAPNERIVPKTPEG